MKRRTFGRIESIRKWKRWTKVLSRVPRNPRCRSFIRVCKDLASASPLFSLVSLNSTRSEMRRLLCRLQTHLVTKIKSAQNAQKCVSSHILNLKKSANYRYSSSNWTIWSHSGYVHNEKREDKPYKCYFMYLWVRQKLWNYNFSLIFNIWEKN